MKSLVVFVSFIIVLAAMALVFPDLLLNPGPLMQGHRHLKKDCMSCHKPFSGASPVQCVSCHKQGDISVRNAAGKLLTRDTARTIFHGGLSAGSCLDCHTDHKGLDAAKAFKSFKHGLLSSSIKKDCASCHRDRKPSDNLHRYQKGSCAECHGTTKWIPATFDHGKLHAELSNNCAACHDVDKPGDTIHRSLQTNCADCHGTKRWSPATFDHSKFAGATGKQCISCHKADKPNDKLHMNTTLSCADCHGTKRWSPATFDHSRFAGASGKQCISCHQADKPNDSLHRMSQASCATCHNTRRWSPATFDHNKYFRLDGDHRASCITCHSDTQNYKTFTCYNCHEHSQAGIAAEHREEGIINYQNCIKCHRDGSEGGKRGGDDD